MGAAEAEPKKSECAERERLLHDYQVAVADYSRVVEVLSARSGVMRRTDYMQIREYSETSRLKSESARRELDGHIAEHGCLGESGGFAITHY